MNPLKSDTLVLPNGTLRLPPHVAGALNTNTPVHVTITPTLRDPQAIRAAIESTFGAWKHDPSIIPIFDQIERDRQRGLMHVFR